MLVPSVADRHLLSRFSWGITPSLVNQSAKAGGARAWFDEQLDPAAMSADLPLADWWPHLEWTAAEKFAADVSGEVDAFEQGNDFARWTLLKRMTSSKQLLEVMADLWSNLLYVSQIRKAFPHRALYDATIRQHALGTYEDLLTASVLHPAMLCYLDNARSTWRAPNENLGRELLELHSVGRAAGYTELDVLNSTRILTGYRVAIGGTCQVYYSPEDHFVGLVQVLDFTRLNLLPDGRTVTREYLSYLARHESTANRIARALAVRFVSDTPSDELIEAVASAYLDSGTDIPTTLRALVDHAEFAASDGVKTRTPAEDFVNTYRTMQVEVSPPIADENCAALAILTQCASMGQRPFDWPRPDGFPDTGEAWSSASRMLGSWRAHKNIAGGIYPKIGAKYQPSGYWLGRMPVRFDALVDRLCRLILSRPSNPRLLDTAVKAVDTQPDQIITSAHVVVRKRMALLLVALLDTPDHMTR